MSIVVLKAGILDTLQDTGRYGYGNWGINPCGAMDQYAAHSANALVGNNLNEGVIEMHFPAGEFLFLQNTLISITGADFSPTIDGKSIPLWKPVHVKTNSVLSFRKKIRGYRSYLAVDGGYDGECWLGSISTHLKMGCGGKNGRALKKKDELLLRGTKYKVSSLNSTHVHSWGLNHRAVYAQPDTISFLEGHEWNWLAAQSQQKIGRESFAISPLSDRMACYLEHEPLVLSHRDELLSSAVSFGTIQMLPYGKLIVLMADHQTTGGYPRIGHIVTAHLPKLAQRSPNEIIRLNKISIEDAEKMIFSLQQNLHEVQQACIKKLNAWYADR